MLSDVSAQRFSCKNNGWQRCPYWLQLEQAPFVCLELSAKNLLPLSLYRMNLFSYHCCCIISLPPGTSRHYRCTIFLRVKEIELGCIDKWSSTFLPYFPTALQMVLRNRHLCFSVEKNRLFWNYGLLVLLLGNQETRGSRTQSFTQHTSQGPLSLTLQLYAQKRNTNGKKCKKNVQPL